MKVGRKAAVAAAVIALSCVQAAACSRKPEHARVDTTTARSVSVGRVELRALAGGLTCTGLLVPREDVAAGAEIGGYRVVKVYVDAGAEVKAGQPLAQLDDLLLQAQVAQHRALVAQRRIAAEQAEMLAADVAGVDREGVMSGEQIDARRSQALSDRAALDAQEALLRDLLLRRQRLTIRAPIGGLVLERNVRLGDIPTVGGSAPMFRLARDRLIELEAQIDEDAITRVAVGESVSVSLPGGAVEGRVRLIDPNIDPKSKLGKVRISLPVRSDLRPGAFGRATFTGALQPRPTIPEVAIRYDGNGASVMVVGPDSRVSQVPVRIGARSGGYAELIQGPPLGARILVGSAAFVLPGDLVSPVADRSSAAVR